LRDDKLPKEVTDAPPASAAGRPLRRGLAEAREPSRASKGGKAQKVAKAPKVAEAPKAKAAKGEAANERGPKPTASKKPSASRTASAPKKSRAKRAAANPLVEWAPHADRLTEQLDDLEKRKKDGKLLLPDGDTLDVTNLQKVFWPGPPFTKGDLLRYYARMAPLILPVIAERPLVMKRFPNGVAGDAFYQHRGPDVYPRGVRVEPVEGADVPTMFVGGRLKTLLYMAQLAAISMDPWFSKMTALEDADQVAIDLDPQPGATFAQILDVARWVRDELDRLHVPAYPKTSGSEGLHIFIPLPPETSYESGVLICQIVATIVATKHPKVATIERMVKRRKDGTIYVDYLQNIPGKTLACAYSARASAFAGVSTPLEWAEIDEKISPQDFTIKTIESRIRSVGDLWAGIREAEPADLAAALDKLRI